jgi:hypothetical protein
MKPVVVVMRCWRTLMVLIQNAAWSPDSLKFSFCAN